VLGIPEDAVAACATIAHGIPRPVDLGSSKRLMAVMARGPRMSHRLVGFDSEANRIANEAPAWLGNLVYAYGRSAR